MTWAWWAPNSSLDESWRFGILACGCWATRVGSRTVRLSFLARWFWRASFCGLAICSWPRLAPQPHICGENGGKLACFCHFSRASLPQRVSPYRERIRSPTETVSPSPFSLEHDAITPGTWRGKALPSAGRNRALARTAVCAVLGRMVHRHRIDLDQCPVERSSCSLGAGRVGEQPTS